MINTSQWSIKCGKVSGKNSNVKQLNSFLEGIRSKLFKCYNNLFNEGKEITCETLRNKYLGIEERKLTLMEVFKNHNLKMKELIGKEFSKGTWERYETSLRHTQAFMKWKFNISDIDVRHINAAFVADYEFYLHTVRDCSKREYIISSAPISQALQQVLNFSGQGKTIQQIVKILINEKIAEEEAIEFIVELIENQVLVSELEPIVSGSDFLEVVISVLNRVGAKNENAILISIQEKLKELDQNIGNSASSYAEIEKLIQSFNVEYKSNHLFQTDLYYKETVNLPSFWKKELKQAISFLNKISVLQKETHLDKFKKAFYERFETQEVSLSYALDTEVGIGYRQDVTTKGLHPYLEDLKLPSKEKLNLKIELDPIQRILNEKIQEALLHSQYIINLLDEDFKNFEESWNDLPDTISFMTEIISDDGQRKLFLDGGGGCSAANLLGRFCSAKSEIQNLINIIAQKEEELNPDYILAEVIHLPDARIGNVIRRPALRQYEIPYLAQSVLPKENQIQVDDLFISLKSNSIVLRSKKLNKEIKPYLTNAHNYSANPLPVYHFLCDLYSQNIRSGLYFNWGDLKHIYNFLPRVEYKNIILSKASWKITDEEIKKFLLLISDKDQLFAELKKWRKLKQVPQWIQWVKSDNKLTVNLENYDLVKMFIDSVKNEESIIIEEFLYNENDDFKREFIFPMYKNK